MAAGLRWRRIGVWCAVSGVEEISDQIGERLRQAREGAGLSVEDVVARARIPRSVIEALEAGNFGVFDSPTYARSFLSQYSEFLKVDAELWLEALEPVAFATVDVVKPSWQPLRPHKDLRTSSVDPSRGWISGLVGLALSCVVIYVAILAYELLEKRFGGDTGDLKVSREKIEQPSPAMRVENAPVADPAPVAEEKSTASKPDPAAEPVPAPPRATIVRENP